MENPQLVNTAIQLPHSLGANARDVQIRRNATAHRLRASSASKNVPLTDMMRTRK